MSIHADPLFVAAEVERRRQLLTMAYPKATRAGRGHASVVRAALSSSVLHFRPGRHANARPANALPTEACHA